MLFEDLEIIWREEGSRPFHTVDEKALGRIVEERARSYRRSIFIRDLSEIATHALVVVLLLGFCLWSILEDDGAIAMNTAALLLTGVGYAFIASFMVVSRQRQKRREEDFEASVHGNLRTLVANADYQIRLKSKFVWWYLLPIAPGFFLITASTADSSLLELFIFGAFMGLLFLWIYWGNRSQLRKVLIPQKRELESLLAELEQNGGKIAGLQPKEAKVTNDAKRIQRILSAVVTAVSLGLVGWFLVTMLRPVQEPRAPAFADVSAFGERDVARIDAWLQEQVELSDYPSLSISIVRDGTTVYQRSFGFENTWAKRKATTNTVYHVASVTKVFTASLAVMLHEQGVLDLDQPVAAYLPKDVPISTQPELGATITLRQLASHTSGLPRRVPGRVQSIEGRYQLEPERLYGHLAEVSLEFEPGTGERYSNLGFGLLGHALERAAGKPLDQLLQELLCRPLNLENTAIHVDDKLPVATGYTTPPRLSESHSYRNRLAGSGGLVSSARDLGTFVAAQMGPGVFTARMLEALHTATELKDGSAATRALGWSIDTNNPTGRVLSKNGGRGNCGAWIGFAPDHGVGVAVVTNIGNPDVDPIGRWLLARSVPGGSRPASAHGYAKVAPYTGVRWEDSQPTVRVNGRWSPLVSIDGIPIDHIMQFAHEEFGDRAHKRFAEDLVELLSTMGHDPAWTVTLGLMAKDGHVALVETTMTEDNRDLVRQ